MAARAAGVLPTVADPARGVPAAVARHSVAGVLAAVARHSFAGVPRVAGWAAGVVPAVAARAARPAGPVRAAQAVTAARPA